MNVNPLVISALSPLGLPCYPNVYEGPAEEYITFNYVDERPALHADDTDTHDETVIRINYFAKTDKADIQANKKAIRQLMRAAGFSIMSTQEIYEDDTKYTHVIVECSIDGVVDDD